LGPIIAVVLVVVLVVALFWWVSEPTSWHACPSLVGQQETQVLTKLTPESSDSMAFEVAYYERSGCAVLPIPTVNGTLSFSGCGFKQCEGTVLIATYDKWEYNQTGVIWCDTTSGGEEGPGPCPHISNTSFSTQAPVDHLTKLNLTSAIFVLVVTNVYLDTVENFNATVYSNTYFAPPPP
jgi:hypothetical protein